MYQRYYPSERRLVSLSSWELGSKPLLQVLRGLVVIQLHFASTNLTFADLYCGEFAFYADSFALDQQHYCGLVYHDELAPVLIRRPWLGLAGAVRATVVEFDIHGAPPGSQSMNHHCGPPGLQ